MIMWTPLPLQVLRTENLEQFLRDFAPKTDEVSQGSRALSPPRGWGGVGVGVVWGVVRWGDGVCVCVCVWGSDSLVRLFNARTPTRDRRLSRRTKLPTSGVPVGPKAETHGTRCWSPSQWTNLCSAEWNCHLMMIYTLGRLLVCRCGWSEQPTDQIV